MLKKKLTMPVSLCLSELTVNSNKHYCTHAVHLLSCVSKKLSTNIIHQLQLKNKNIKKSIDIWRMKNKTKQDAIWLLPNIFLKKREKKT